MMKNNNPVRPAKKLSKNWIEETKMMEEKEKEIKTQTFL